MKKEIKLHPDEFEMECTTVWSFPRRGNWATHKSDWRGNWAPEVVRNLILRYSKEGEHLLDCMIGGGTTAIEAKILDRHITCVDVNEEALERTKKALEFEVDNKSKQRIKKCDARDMKFIKNEEIDFVLTHPPYADIIKYSDGKIAEDLSGIHDLDKFTEEIGKVAKELYRVLKNGKYCAILIGDTRRNKMYQPLAYKVMNEFLKQGFLLKEDIIKKQHNCKATGFWVNRSKESNFLLIMHEHLFVFQKVTNTIMGKCRICGKHAEDPYQLCYACNQKEKERRMRLHGKRRCKKCNKVIPADSTYCYDCNPCRKK